MSTFSEKLRILRKNKEWTQAQLADALSVSESTVQKWEVSQCCPGNSASAGGKEVISVRNQYPEVRTRLIEYINQYYREHSSAPSLRNIAAELNLSKSSVQRYLISLCDEGLIDYDESGIITEEMQDHRMETVQIEVLNTGFDIPDPNVAGIRERFQVPASLFGNTNLCLIRIHGDKLRKEIIDDGDMILFRKQNWTRKGDLAIIFIPDHGTSLVRMSEDFHSSNDPMDETAGKPLRVLGVVKKVIKDV